MNKLRVFAAIFVAALVYLPGVAQAESYSKLGSLYCFKDGVYLWEGPAQLNVVESPDRFYVFEVDSISDGSPWCSEAVTTVEVDVSTAQWVSVTPGSVTTNGSVSCNPVPSCTASASVTVTPPTVWIYVCVDYAVKVNGNTVASGTVCIWAQIP